MVVMDVSIVTTALPDIHRHFGVAVTVVGMIWLTRIAPGSSYFLAFALPLVLLGVGQGLSQGPLTAEGLVGVAHSDAGAASGITYVASQVGTSFARVIHTVVSVAAPDIRAHLF